MTLWALDRAIMAAYHHAGITSDPRTWARPAPQLAHLAAALRADGSEAAAVRIRRAALAAWLAGRQDNHQEENTAA